MYVKAGEWNGTAVDVATNFTVGVYGKMASAFSLLVFLEKSDADKSEDEKTSE